MQQLEAIVPVAELTLAMTHLQLAIERNAASGMHALNPGMHVSDCCAYLALERAMFRASCPQRVRFRSGALLPEPPGTATCRQVELRAFHPQTRRLFARWLAARRKTTARSRAQKGPRC